MTLRVNGEPIADAVVLTELQRLIRFYSEHLPKAEIGRQMPALLKKAREQAIGAKLLLDEARRRGIQVAPEEADKRIQQMTEEAGGEERFAALLEKQKVTIDQLRAGVIQGRQIDRLVAEITRFVPEPEEEELREWYEGHPGDFQSPPRAQARHILIKPATAASGDREVAESRLMELRAQALAGAEFGDLAAAFSECPSGKSTGGSLGWITQGITLPEFDDVLFRMKTGEISEVVQTPLGLHLVQKTAEEAGGETVAFEDIKDQIRDLMIHTRKGEALAKIVEQLKNRAEIEDDGEFDQRPGAPTDPEPLS
jgi:parvulin-like peptidyl-prolyl isomerase